MTTRTRKVGWLRHKGGAAVDATAARVLGMGRKKSAEQKLKAKAARTSDAAEQAKLVGAAERAARAKSKKLVSPAAEACAKRALARAHWKRGLK